MQRTDDIVNIQSMIRGQQARNSYEINDLNIYDCEFNKTFVVGNDPVMSVDLDGYCEAKDKIGLVATSGLRVVSLACKLGNFEQLPKIILVDYSYKVTQFWKKIRDLMQDEHGISIDNFSIKLSEFLDQNSCLYEDLSMYDFTNGYVNDVTYLTQDILRYFNELIQTYGFDYVRKVISHASIITQSWGDVETFVKIKNILNYIGVNKVFVYPSNIIRCIPDQELQDTILNNIHLLSPMLSIHTDHCRIHDLPERIFLIENNEPSAVRLKLFSSDCIKPESENLHKLQILLRQLSIMESKIAAKESELNTLNFAGK